MSDNPPLDRTNFPDNDGTNACTFIGLAICDRFRAMENVLSGEEIKTISEDIYHHQFTIVSKQIKEH